MNGTGRLGLFLYDTLDAQAAEDWLNRKAQKGWALTRLWLCTIALFRRSKRTDLRYRVELQDPRQAAGEAYRSRCADGGWDPVAQAGNLVILASRPVAQPAHLRTEAGMEARSDWRLAVRPALWSGVSVLLVLLALLVGFGLMNGHSAPVRWSGLLCSTALLLAVLGLLAGLAGSIWNLPAALLRWRHWKGGKTAPKSGPSFARVRGALRRLGWLCTALFFVFSLFEAFLPLAGYSGRAVSAHRGALRERPLVMAEEVGLDPAAVTYLSWEPVWSLQARGGRYMEQMQAEGGYQYVYCQRYTCMSEGYAALLVRAIRAESGTYNYEGYGLLDFQRADLGFVGSWTAREGSFLLVRQGRTVALVGVHVMGGGAPDLTEPETLAILRDRLELAEM